MARNNTGAEIYGVKQLERDHMEAVIKRGGGVIVRDENGENERIITVIDDLPAPAAPKLVTAEGLDAQIAALTAKKEVLAAGAQPQSEIKPALDAALDDGAIAAKLKDAGLDTADKIKAATDDQLRAIPGFGPVAVAKIRAMQNA